MQKKKEKTQKRQKQMRPHKKKKTEPALICSIVNGDLLLHHRTRRQTRWGIVEVFRHAAGGALVPWPGSNAHIGPKAPCNHISGDLVGPLQSFLLWTKRLEWSFSADEGVLEPKPFKPYESRILTSKIGQPIQMMFKAHLKLSSNFNMIVCYQTSWL